MNFKEVLWESREKKKKNMIHKGKKIIFSLDFSGETS